MFDFKSKCFYFSNWHHGSPYRIEMNNGDEHSYTLEGERFNYLDQEKQCTNETFEDQWWPSLAKTDFSGCEYQCLPFYIPASDMEVCDWNKTEDEVRHCNGLKVCTNLIRHNFISNDSRKLFHRQEKAITCSSFIKENSRDHVAFSHTKRKKRG